MTAPSTVRRRADMPQDQLPAQAHAFLRQRHNELGVPGLARRWREVRVEIRANGTWRPTYDELAYAARVAWRNSGRCIGRLRWPSLIVRDRRHITTLQEVRRELAAHLDEATNGGRIRSVITVLAPATHTGPPPVRIISPQLARYAAWQSRDGVLGDPTNVALTHLATYLGWSGPTRRGLFDILPWIAATNDGRLHLLPAEPAHILEVPIHHPDHPWIADLGLRWPAVPVISKMALHFGGLQFPAPFSGTFMASEIATRNLADAHRYHQLPAIIAGLGLDDRDRLRADKALLTLHEAVLHSFETAGVSITDHHRESRAFARFVQREEAAGRVVVGDWSWLNSYPRTPQAPPGAATTTPANPPRPLSRTRTASPSPPAAPGPATNPHRVSAPTSPRPLPPHPTTQGRTHVHTHTRQTPPATDAPGRGSRHPDGRHRRPRRCLRARPGFRLPRRTVQREIRGRRLLHAVRRRRSHQLPQVPQLLPHHQPVPRYPGPQHRRRRGLRPLLRLRQLLRTCHLQQLDLRARRPMAQSRDQRQGRHQVLRLGPHRHGQVLRIQSRRRLVIEPGARGCAGPKLRTASSRQLERVASMR